VPIVVPRPEQVARTRTRLQARYERIKQMAQPGSENIFPYLNQPVSEP
jgi:hypothetical protein